MSSENVSGSKKVVVSLEYLCKLFIMPDSMDRFIEFGKELLNLIHSFFQEKGGIHSSISIHELAALFSDPNIPESPDLLKNVLFEIKEKLVAHSVKVGNPYYIGHMTSAVPYFMILLEMIIAALNQNQVKIESAKASTFLEREFVIWMHRLVYRESDDYYKENFFDREIAVGTVTSGGTLSNLAALLVARNKLFKPEGNFKGIRKSGLFEAYKHYNTDKAVIIVSERGHYSIDKAARILGIGEDNVIKIPVDEEDKMNVALLEDKLNEIKEHNEKNQTKIQIIAVIAIAGNTETGNIDPIDKIAELTLKHKVYFHVDAAWGGSLLICDSYRYMYAGIDKADSVSLDAHKLMYSPVSIAVCVFKNRNDLENIKHTSNYIIRPDSMDLGRFTIEGSRPFSCLKPWATLKIIGKKGFELLFEHSFILTKELIKIIDEHPNFERTNSPQLFITNYRFVPETVREKLYKLKQEENILEFQKINDVLNELNIELHKAIREEDNSFVSRTSLVCRSCCNLNTVILRTVTINPLTTKEILVEIIEQQNRLGMSIFTSFFSERMI